MPYRSLSHLSLIWKIIGLPTKKGHPRHPLYNTTESKFVDFDMQKYVTEKLQPKSKEFETIYLNGIEFK